MSGSKRKMVWGLVVAGALGVVTPVMATDVTTVAMPADLAPVGIINKLLTDNAAQIGGVIGFAFVAGLVVAAIHLVRSRFAKKGGSVVK